MWKEVRDVKVRYTALNDHSILVEMDYRPTSHDRPVIPRFGMQMPTSRRFVTMAVARGRTIPTANGRPSSAST